MQNCNFLFRQQFSASKVFSGWLLPSRILIASHFGASISLRENAAFHTLVPMLANVVSRLDEISCYVADAILVICAVANMLFFPS